MSVTELNKPSQAVALSYLIILGSIWGLHFSVVKLAAESGISYSGIVAATTVGTALILLIIGLCRKRFLVWNSEHVRFYLICALLGYIIPFFLELVCAANLPASVLTLIASNSPVFTVLIAYFMRSDVINKRIVMSILFGAMSALVIVFPASIGVSNVAANWVVIALVIPLVYALYHNYVKKAWPPESDSFQIACGEACVAFVILVPVYFYNGHFSEFTGHSGYGYLAIFAIIIFGIIEIFLYFEIIRFSGPIFASQATYVTIISGVVWGMIIFNESLSVWIILSTLLLIISLYLSITKRPQAKT